MNCQLQSNGPFISITPNSKSFLKQTSIALISLITDSSFIIFFLFLEQAFYSSFNFKAFFPLPFNILHLPLNIHLEFCSFQIPFSLLSTTSPNFHLFAFWLVSSAHRELLTENGNPETRKLWINVNTAQ